VSKKKPAKESTKDTPKKARPGGRESRFTPEQIIQALEANNGMIVAAARSIHCSRKTIYNKIAKHPEIKDALAGMREFQLDRTEIALFRAIERGEAWAICFYLKTQGKQRGYIEKQEIDVNVNDRREAREEVEKLLAEVAAECD